MYALDIPSFCSGRLLAYLTDHLRAIGKASSVAMILASRVNWKAESGFGPRGTVNHLTARQIAELAGCSISTVHEHLSVLKALGIIQSELVKDDRGAVLYARFWFSGFIGWLMEKASPRQHSEGNADQLPGGGGSEKSETIQEDSSKDIIDLHQTENVRYTALEELIRAENPKCSDGSAADCQVVFDRFRSWNLSKGQQHLPTRALRAFARCFREFRRPSPAAKPAEVAQKPELKPVFAASPVGQMLSAVWDTNPSVYKAWFEKLRIEARGDGWDLVTPSAFQRDYLRTNWADFIERFSTEASPISIA